MLSIFLFTVIFSFLCALFSTPEQHAYAVIHIPPALPPKDVVCTVSVEDDAKVVSPEQLMMAWAALYNLPAKN